MYIRFIALFTLITTTLLTGCAEYVVKDGEVEVAGGMPIGGRSKDAQAIATDRRGNLIIQPSSTGTSQSENLITTDPLTVKVILFDFDSSSIRPSSEAVLLAHSHHLTANSQTQVTLEGHADERGTREYNLALGEQRALAVKQFLMDHGVAETQLQTLSYGEERPANAGSNESAWELNRRVELAY